MRAYVCLLTSESARKLSTVYTQLLKALSGLNISGAQPLILNSNEFHGR